MLLRIYKYVKHEEADTENEAALFRVLANPTRLKLAILLALREESCVCMLADALGEPESKVSRHLSVMRAAGMVQARREGTWMHYRLAEPRSDVERSLQECLRGPLAAVESLRKVRERFMQAICLSELSPAERRAARAASGAHWRSPQKQESTPGSETFARVSTVETM